MGAPLKPGARSRPYTTAVRLGERLAACGGGQSFAGSADWCVVRYWRQRWRQREERWGIHYHLGRQGVVGLLAGLGVSVSEFTVMAGDAEVP